MREEEEQERQAARQLARERVLRDFEKLQSGAGSSDATTATSSGKGTVEPTPTESIGERGTKRKFALDEQEVTRLQDEHEEKAMREIEREQADKRKAKLPNFWLVRQTTCTAGEPSNEY